MIIFELYTKICDAASKCAFGYTVEMLVYSSDILLKNFVILLLLQQSLTRVLTRRVRMNHGIMNIKGNHTVVFMI